jgi:hypothetical protein
MIILLFHNVMYLTTCMQCNAETVVTYTHTAYLEWLLSLQLWYQLCWLLVG